MIVTKLDGMLRLCVDFRKVNKVAVLHVFPMPRIDNMLEKIGTAKYISIIDLTKGYWQIPMVVRD